MDFQHLLLGFPLIKRVDNLAMLMGDRGPAMIVCGVKGIVIFLKRVHDFGNLFVIFGLKWVAVLV